MTALDDALAPYGLRGHTMLRPGPSLRAAFEREVEREMAEIETAMERQMWTDPSVPPVLEAILADDEMPPGQAFLFEAPWLHGPAVEAFVAKWLTEDRPLEPRVTVAPAHHGYDAIVTIAVMPLPPQPEIGNGDHEAWRRYILAMEGRGHARALLDGICEGVWEQ